MEDPAVTDSTKGRTGRLTSNRIFIRIIIGLVLVFAVASAVAIYFEQETQMERMLIRRAALENQLAEIKAEQAELQDLQNMVDTDEYIERVAREQLGMVRPNEIIFED
jgi:cell division protein DivIC